MFVFYLINSLSVSKSCTICQTTCKALNTGLNAGFSSKIMIDEVKNQCAKQPKEIQNACLAPINNYNLVVSELKKNVTPETICSKYSLCDPKEAEWSLFDEFSKMNEKMWCSTCKSFVDWLRPSVEGMSISSIRNFLKNSCSNYPNFKEFCKTITDQQIKILVQGILNGYTTLEFCQWVKYCP